MKNAEKFPSGWEGCVAYWRGKIKGLRSEIAEATLDSEGEIEELEACVFRLKNEILELKLELKRKKEGKGNKKKNMRITERRLLDGYEAKHGGYNISYINNSQICWGYRKGKHYSDGGNPVCDRLSAMEITLEYGRAGTLPLQARCATHPSLAKISHDEAKMWGAEV